MGDLTVIVLAGLLGTSSMTLFMWFITDFGLANSDMVRAIGSLYTKSVDDAFTPGLVIQYCFGLAFAFVYAAFVGLFSPETLFTYIVLTTMFSLLHGLVVSFSLVVIVAQYHPLERFRDAGSEVAVGHLVGHFVYGLTVGLVLGAAKVDLVIFTP